MKKILLIEKSTVTAYLLKNQLEDDFKCTVTIYTTIYPSLLAVTTNYDLLIIDHAIVADNNFRAQLYPLFKSIPTLIFSNERKLKDAVNLIRMGAIDYIDKSTEFFLDEIIQSVENLFHYSSIDNKLKHTQQRLQTNQKLSNRLLILSVFLALLLFIA